MQGFPKFTRRVAPLASVLLLLGAAEASAQRIEILLTDGDIVPGVTGTLSGIKDVYITDDGQWVTRVTMAQTSGSTDSVILNGAVVLIEGDPLFDPPGGLVVEAFDEVSIGEDGTLWWNIRSDGATASDEILYRNLIKIGQEGSLVFDPTQDPTTIWKDFDGFDLNSNGDLLILGDIDSPDISGSSDAALALQTFDSSGILISEDFLILEGDSLPGISETVKDVGTNSAGNDVAHSNNHWIAYVRNSGSSSGDEMVMVDGVIVAQESKNGPVIPSTWKRMSSNAVDINDAGDYVFRADYQIIGGALIKALHFNAQPIINSGETTAAIAPHAWESFGTTQPIRLGENGNIVFHGQTDNSDSSQDQGFFVGERALILEGVTQIGGSVLTTLSSSGNLLNMSPNGRFVIAQGTFGDGRQTLLRIDLGLIQIMSSSTTAKATLVHTDGLPLIGDVVDFQMDGEQDFGVTPFLLISTAPIAGWLATGDGVITPFGELLIDVTSGNPGIILTGPPSDFSAVDFAVAIPNDLALSGREFYAQGLYWDIGDISPQENFRLTNGLQISVGG